jgi:uncharacterized phage infection (PIP) family protein YhgE
MANSLSDGAQATSDAFTSLNNSINAFTATFANFAFEQNKMDNETAILLNAQIDSLKAKIAVYVPIDIFRLKDRLTPTRYDTQLTDLAIGIGATAVASIGAVFLFPEFAPVAIVRLPYPCITLLHSNRN